MANGWSSRVRKAMLDAKHNVAAYSAPATLWAELYVGDPGEAGAGGTRVTGGGYTVPSVTAATFWAAASNATPSVAASAAALNFGTSTGAWAAGGNIDFVAFYNHATLRTATEFESRHALTAARVVGSAGIGPVTVAAGDLTDSLTSTP